MTMFASQSSSFTRSIAVVLCIFLLRSAQALHDRCEVNFYGQSHVGLSEQKSIFEKEIDPASYTYELLFNPRHGGAGEQSLLQTGIVQSAGGFSWAVEFKFKTTIWAHQQPYPASSVIYIDLWHQPHAHSWSKTRHYIVLGLESFPWVHISFSGSGGGSGIAINGKAVRLDKYSVVTAEGGPREAFALGDSFSGALDDLRIWRAAKDTPTDVHSTLCVDAVKPKLALYLPFNECKGDVFTGYTSEGPVCAILRGGSYDVKGADGQVINSIWNYTSPVVSQECTPVDQLFCADAKAKDAEHASTPSPVSDSEDANNTVFRVFDFRTGGLLLVVVGVLALVGYSRRVRREERAALATV